MSEFDPLLGALSLAGSSWRGGRGQLSPLGTWLLAKALDIEDKRNCRPSVSWAQIAERAANDGIRRADGQAYSVKEVRTAWWRLRPRTSPPPARANKKILSREPMKGQRSVMATSGKVTSSTALPTRHYGDDQ